MRTFPLILIATGLASAQCYQFSAPGVTYSMNIQSVASSQMPLSYLSQFIVKQQSILTVGGRTYTSTSGTANLNFSSVQGASTMNTFFVDTVDPPTWGVDIILSGTLTFFPTSLPASIPAIGLWNLGTPQMSVTIGGGAAVNYTITAIGTCAASGGGSGVPGQSLGDASTQDGCPFCGQPITIGTGNMFEEAEDYHTAGANRLAFHRYYNSMAASPTFATALGKNWRSSFDRYLDISPSSVVAERPDGRQVTFTSSGGVWTTDADIDMTLTNSGSTWTLTDHMDTVETYNAVSATEGLLQTIKSRNGYTQSMQYGSGNQLTVVMDTYGRQLSLSYNNGLLGTVTTPDGLVLSYGFSANGVLLTVSYSTTPVTLKTYVYENSSFPNALTGIIDENGTRFASWTYDSTGRALTSQHSGGADLITVAYNDSDGSRTVTGPLGQQAVYRFSTIQSVPKVTEIDFNATSTTPASKTMFTYDGNGYISSRTDWNGNVTNVVNNSRGLPISIAEASGTPQARTTSITYHPTFRLPVQIVRPNVTASFTYDNSGELLTFTLADTTTTSVPYATAGQSRTWTFTWANSLPASSKGPRTDVSATTTFGYDASGSLISLTNSLNQEFQITRHSPGGLPLTVVDPNGVTATFTYDGRQRLSTSTIGTAAGPVTAKLAYDGAGNLTTYTLPDGSAYNNAYDGAHRLIATADLLGQSINYTLDANGDPKGIAVKDVSGNPQLKRTGVYDALGRILQAVGGAGQTTSYAYDLNGNITTISDGLNHPRQQTFDPLNRLIKVVDAAQGTTSIAYDPMSRPVSVTDPNGATTLYTYDGFGGVIQEVNPASGTTVYRYDAAGNLTQRVDARGVITNYTYDALNRRTSIAYPGNSAENVTMTYDQNSFGVGRLSSITDAAGTLNRTYDERGNLLTETRVQGSATLTTSYGYDAASRIAAITYPSHWSVAFNRDQLGRVTSAAATAPGTALSRLLFSAVGYQPFGPVNSITYGNGISETQTFDPDYRLTKLTSQVENLSYAYDADNNVLSIADGINSANTQSLGYDSLNRLTSASGAYGRLAYTYDANGNRSSESSSATSDGLGQMTTLTYNQAGRLAGTSSGSQQLTQYTYDAFGRRLVKAGASTATTRYQYHKDGSLLEEADAQGNAQVDYIYLNNRPVATIQAGAIHFLHDDRLGTPQLATDSVQAVAWSTTYQPFGIIAAVPALIAEDLRLPGQEADVETGLYHNGYRDYAPGAGKYIESDPSGLAGGTNRYAYGDGNPVGAVDPKGLDASLSAQVTTLCNLAENCSLLNRAKIALTLETTPATPYVPPSAPQAPPQMTDESGALTPYGAAVMWCGSAVHEAGPSALSGCAPAAQPVVAQAWADQQTAQLQQTDTSFENQVLYPSALTSLSYAGLAATWWNAATPFGDALTELLATTADTAEGLQNGNEAINPVPSSNSLGTFIGALTKDLLQAAGQVAICPKTGVAVSLGN